MSKVNILPICIVVVVNQALGALWYSPLLFGTKWMDLVGKSAEELSSRGALPYLIAMIGSVFLAYILSRLVVLTHASTIAEGVWIGFLFWLGIAMPAIVVHYVFIGHPWALVLIDGGNTLLNMAVGGAILAVVR